MTSKAKLDIYFYNYVGKTSNCVWEIHDPPDFNHIFDLIHILNSFVDNRDFSKNINLFEKQREKEKYLENIFLSLVHSSNIHPIPQSETLWRQNSCWGRGTTTVVCCSKDAHYHRADLQKELDPNLGPEYTPQEPHHQTTAPASAILLSSSKDTAKSLHCVQCKYLITCWKIADKYELHKTIQQSYQQHLKLCFMINAKTYIFVLRMMKIVKELLMHSNVLCLHIWRFFT